jgi:hypothetical protein
MHFFYCAGGKVWISRATMSVECWSNARCILEFDVAHSWSPHVIRCGIRHGWNTIERPLRCGVSRVASEVFLDSVCRTLCCSMRLQAVLELSK